MLFSFQPSIYNSPLLLYYFTSLLYLLLYHTEVFYDVVEEAFEFDLTVAADDEIKHLGGVFGGGGVDDFETGGGAQCNILGEEVLFADGVDEEVVLLFDERFDGFIAGQTPEVDVGLTADDVGGLVCDDEAYLLVALQQCNDVDVFALVFHHFGKVVEDVPVLFVAQTADDADVAHFVDVVDFLLTRGGLEVANQMLAMYFFDKLKHIYIECVIVSVLWYVSFRRVCVVGKG